MNAEILKIIIEALQKIVEIVEPTAKEPKEPFQVRETSKGLRRKKSVIKPGRNGSVSEKRVELMLEAFMRFDVDEGDLASYLGKPMTMAALTDDDMVTLIGIHNRLKAGENPEDIFAPF